MKSIKRNLKLRKLEEYAMDKLVKIDNFLNKPDHTKSNKAKVRNMTKLTCQIAVILDQFRLVLS